MGFARCGHLYQALPEFSRCRDPREDNNAHAICPRIDARPRTGRKRRPAGHHIIHQANVFPVHWCIELKSTPDIGQPLFAGFPLRYGLNVAPHHQIRGFLRPHPRITEDLQQCLHQMQLLMGPQYHLEEIFVRPSIQILLKVQSYG